MRKLLHVNGWRVAVSNLCPPIPTRKYDYCAVLDDYYDGASEGMSLGTVQGWGATEAEAVQELMDEIEEHNL